MKNWNFSLEKPSVLMGWGGCMYSFLYCKRWWSDRFAMFSTLLCWISCEELDINFPYRLKCNVKKIKLFFNYSLAQYHKWSSAASCLPGGRTQQCVGWAKAGHILLFLTVSPWDCQLLFCQSFKITVSPTELLGRGKNGWPSISMDGKSYWLEEKGSISPAEGQRKF